MSILAESEESAHTRALKLEKENKHLQALINTYKDSIKSGELTQVRPFDYYLAILLLLNAKKEFFRSTF